MTKQAEKLVKEIRVMVQPSLYDDFHEICVENYANISVIIRNLMLEYVREYREKRNMGKS